MDVPDVLVVFGSAVLVVPLGVANGGGKVVDVKVLDVVVAEVGGEGVGVKVLDVVVGPLASSRASACSTSS